MPWYRDLEGAIEYHDGITLEDINSQTIDHASLEQRTGFLKTRLHDGSVIDISGASDGHHKVKSNAKTVANSILRLIRNEVDTTFVKVE